MCGNMKLGDSILIDSDFGLVVDGDERWVDFEEGSAPSLLGFDAGAEIGRSFASSKSVSAATMPPIEWPTRIVCTEGSTVGDGVSLYSR